MEIASDNLTGGGSSHLMKATKPMEYSSAVAFTFPTKRKAESDPAKEIEEIEDENEEIEDEDEECSDESEEMDWATKDRRWVEETNAYYKSLWITPEWDVDSFEDLKFDSSEEEEGTEGIDKEDVQDWLRFRRQHVENKGFYVDPKLWPMYKYSEYRVFEDLDSPTGTDKTYHEIFKEMACLCLQKFNEKQKEKNENFINVEFVKVVGAVIRPSASAKYFITFMAKEKPGGPDVEYQAKVWTEFVKGSAPKNHPILCRRAPPPKTSNQN